MFRFFENFVDPYIGYPQEDRPPTTLWPFMKTYTEPFRRFFCAALTPALVTLNGGLIVGVVG